MACRLGYAIRSRSPQFQKGLRRMRTSLRSYALRSLIFTILFFVYVISTPAAPGAAGGISPFAPASATTWMELGPDPIPNGQTNGTSVPVSGRVAAIAVHPTNPNIIYVGAAQGGVYRSLDGGATWTPLMDNA